MAPQCSETELKVLDCYKGAEPYDTLMGYVRWDDL